MPGHWPASIAMTGYWHDPGFEASWEPPPLLRDFLAGATLHPTPQPAPLPAVVLSPAPSQSGTNTTPASDAGDASLSGKVLYVGFGSMSNVGVLPESRSVLCMLLTVGELLGLRVVLVAHGSADLRAAWMKLEDEVQENQHGQWGLIKGLTDRHGSCVH